MEVLPFSVRCVLLCWVYSRWSLCSQGRWLLARPTIPFSLFLQEGSDWPGWVSCPSPSQSLWCKGFWFASLGHVLTLGIKEVSPGSLKSKRLNGITMRWGARLPREMCWQIHICSPHGSFFHNTLHLSNDNLLSHVPSKPPKEESSQKRRGTDSLAAACLINEFLSLLWGKSDITGLEFIHCQCPIHLLGRMGAPGSLPQDSFTQSEDEC